eukprot:6383012-Alexandrium_andersonii.AAC.1
MSAWSYPRSVRARDIAAGCVGACMVLGTRRRSGGGRFAAAALEKLGFRQGSASPVCFYRSTRQLM